VRLEEEGRVAVIWSRGAFHRVACSASSPNNSRIVGSTKTSAAQTEEAALVALAEFEKKWGERYPMVAQAWRSNWERVRPFFAFGKEVRKIIYPTNAIAAERIRC